MWPLLYSGMPLSDVEIDEFHDTLLACDAVVGVNTTAMIEAAIVGRPVLTVRDAAFAHSQQETLHFQYLVDDSEGCAQVARSLDEHVAQLERTVTHPGERREALAAFVRSVRAALRPRRAGHEPALRRHRGRGAACVPQPRGRRTGAHGAGQRQAALVIVDTAGGGPGPDVGGRGGRVRAVRRAAPGGDRSEVDSTRCQRLERRYAGAAPPRHRGSPRKAIARRDW